MGVVLTGIKPSADQIHLGNYFGAVKQLLELQKEHKIFFMIADLHALTTIHQKNYIGTASLKQAKIYLACGLDLNNVVLFRQHKIPAHTELNWVLSCITPFGTLRRMHAFKDALVKNKHEKISAGIFNYPTLMAADILIYNPDFVPVGQDQKQHVEYAQDIAQRFNNLFGETFKIPKELINKDISKIPGIDGRKMSKSYDNYIGILDDENTLYKKTRRIVTDSIPLGTPKNPDECNVYNLLKLFLSDDENQVIRKQYKTGKFSFKNMKDLLYEKLISFLKPIQKNYKELSDSQTLKILEENEKKCRNITSNLIKKVYDNIGL